jgi:hypothetical protein
MKILKPFLFLVVVISLLFTIINLNNQKLTELSWDYWEQGDNRRGDRSERLYNRCKGR